MTEGERIWPSTLEAANKLIYDLETRVAELEAAITAHVESMKFAGEHEWDYEELVAALSHSGDTDS